MQESLQNPAFSKQEVLHCAGIVGAGVLYSLGINLFVVPAGLYTGGIMGFAQLLRTFFLYLTGLELKIDIAGIINYAIARFYASRGGILTTASCSRRCCP